MIQLRTFALQLLLGLCGGAAQAQFQVVHDVPNTSSNPQITPLILADGNTVTYQWNDGQHIFRKYDTNGGLVWSRGMEAYSFNTFDGGPSVVLLKNGVDGFRFVFISDITETPLGGSGFESLLERTYQVANVDITGEVSSSFRIVKSYVIDFLDDYSQGSIDAAQAPDGGLVISSILKNGAAGSVDIMKINAAGGVEWVSNVGQYWGAVDTPTPTVCEDVEPRVKVVVASTGGIYFTEGSSVVPSNFSLGALGVNGDLLRLKKYIYANIGPSSWFDDIEMDQAGNVHMAGSLSTTVGQFHYFLRTDPDGVLDRGDLYRTPYGHFDGKFGIDALGRRYHLVNTRPIVGLGAGFSQGLLLADTLDNPAQLLRRADQVILPNNVFIAPHALDVSGSRVAVTGSLHHEHVDLAFTTRYETLASMETGALSACLFSDTALAHIEIPLEIMTTEDIPNAASIDVSSYYTSEPITLSFTALDPEPLEGLCAFASEILGVNLGLDESSTSEQAPLVLNSLVAQGTPVVLNDAKVNAVAVYDVHGALVQRTNMSAGRAIATTGWPSGVYILHAMDAHGMPLRVGRVVVE